MLNFDTFIILLSTIILFCNLYRDKKRATNWPLVGMLPAVLVNLHRIHDAFTNLLHRSNLTFVFKGPWFTGMDKVVTIDPANVHYIMSKNFANYPKGSQLKDMLDVLGDGIFNTDFTVWEYHRKMAISFLHNPGFHQFLVKKTWDKVENGLIPLLDHVSGHGLEVDLQDVFTRFTFDTISTIITDHDPRSLSIELPSVPAFKALDDIEETIFYRHVVPMCIWKLLRWFDFGYEKKYKQAWKTLDSFVYKSIATKREELSKQKDDTEVSIDLLTFYIKNDEKRRDLVNNNHTDKFLRDTILNYFIAGRDTTSATLSWFFYLLSKNPQVMSSIKNELNSVTLNKTNFNEVNSKLPYLHGALCETLRLYPPVVFEAKTPMEPDVLPSGHHVDPSIQILLNMWSMGRTKSIWGEDCNEFKPERWISEKGKIKHEPSYKFLAFNAGPRTCLGKDMAFTQMKIVIASIIKNYVIEPVEGHIVVPNLSILLHMKYGFKVRVKSLLKIDHSY